MTLGVMIGSSPRVKFGNNLNIVVDGNSLIAGQGGAQNIPRVLAKSSPISITTHPISQSYDATQIANSSNYTKWQSDKGVSVVNVGVSGETWRKMNGLDGGVGPATTDSSYDSTPGKTNVLVLWEGTNSITSGRTAAQAISDAADYIAARKAIHSGWIILIGTCLPRQNSGSDQIAVNTLNASLDSYNTMLRSQYKSMGAHGLFDVRQNGSLFNWYDSNGNPDYRIATFEANCTGSTSLWQGTDFGWPSEVGAHTHLNSNGYAYVANTFIIPALKRLKPR